MTTYTIVGYKNNKDDYYRGCHMGSVNSDFFIESYSELEDAARWYAKYDMEDPYQRDRNIDHSWELTILFDGRDEYEFSCYQDNEIVDAYNEKIISLFKEQVEKEKARIQHERDEEARKKARAEKARKTREKNKKAKEKEAQERQELERLKEKYETE